MRTIRTPGFPLRRFVSEMKDRAILHSDANCFYASVETVLEPSLRDKAVAVCGSTDERHGIVLAKSERAKRAGVKTGMANWQALNCCKDLIIVPTQYEYYLKFSQYLHKIYRRYTDQVEAFGMDECWLDVTGSLRIFGSARKIAEQIRLAVREELGLTVSIGVSFNKVFAKLGAVSQQLSLDVQGRIRICDKLLQFANLTTTVAIVGSVRMLKVYNPEVLGPEDEIDIEGLDADLAAAGM